jgi:Protein of unknown function (DUF2917)
MNTLFRRRDAPAEHLPARALLRLKDRGKASLRCLEGVCWVTQEGDPEDHVLGPGEEFRPSRSGQVLVWAVTEARLRVERGGRGSPWRLWPLAYRRPGALAGEGLS